MSVRFGYATADPARRAPTGRCGGGRPWRDYELGVRTVEGNRSFDDFGFFGVSVSLALDAAVEDLCSCDPRISRYGKVRLSTVGRLRVLGFALLPTLARPHYDVVLPDLTDETLDRLELAFDLAITRPTSRKDR